MLTYAWVLQYQPDMSITRQPSFVYAEFAGIVPLESRGPEGRAGQQQQFCCKWKDMKRLEILLHFYEFMNILNVTLTP